MEKTTAPKPQDPHGDKAEGFAGQSLFVLPAEAFRRFAEHPLVRRLYPTDAGYFPHAEGHYRDRPKGTEEAILLICTAGKGRVWIDGDTRRLQAGQALCIPPGRPHGYAAESGDPWSILWVHLQGEDLAYYPIDRCAAIKLPPDAIDRLMLLFGQLFRTLCDSYTQSNFIYITQLLGLILAEVYQRTETPGVQARDRKLTEIVRYMNDHLAEPLPLEDVCRRFDISRSRINELFRRCTGRATIEFLICMRMNRACQLLKTTNMRVAEVGQAVGYDNALYFTRLFHNTVGEPPSVWRKNGRAVSETVGYTGAMWRTRVKRKTTRRKSNQVKRT